MSESNSSDASLTVRLKLNDKDIRDKLKSLKTDIRSAFQDASYMVRGPAVAGQAPAGGQAPPKGEVLKFEGGPPAGVRVYGEHITVAGEGARDPERRQNIFVNVQLGSPSEEPERRPESIPGKVALGVGPVKEVNTVGEFKQWAQDVLESSYGGIKFGLRGTGGGLARKLRAVMKEIDLWIGRGVISSNTIIGDVSRATFGGKKLGQVEQMIMDVRDEFSYSTGTAQRTRLAGIEKAYEAGFRGPASAESVLHESLKDISQAMGQLTKGGTDIDPDIQKILAIARTSGVTGVEELTPMAKLDVVIANQLAETLVEAKTSVGKVGKPEHARQLMTNLLSKLTPYLDMLMGRTSAERESAQTRITALLIGRNIELTGMAKEILRVQWRDFVFPAIQKRYGADLPSWITSSFTSVFRFADVTKLMSETEKRNIIATAGDDVEMRQMFAQTMWNKMLIPENFIQFVGEQRFTEEVTKGTMRVSARRAGQLRKQYPTGSFNPARITGRTHAPVEETVRIGRWKKLLEITEETIGRGGKFSQRGSMPAAERARLKEYIADSVKELKFPFEVVDEFFQALVMDEAGFVATEMGEEGRPQVKGIREKIEAMYSELRNQTKMDVLAQQRETVTSPQTRLQNIRKPAKANLGRGLRPTKEQIAGRRVRLDALGGLIEVSEGVTFYREIFESVRGDPESVNNFMAFLEGNRTTNNEYSVMLSYLGVPHKLKDPKRNLIATLQNELLTSRPDDVSTQTQSITGTTQPVIRPDPDPELLKKLRQFNIYQDFLKDVTGVEYAARSTREIDKEAKIPRSYTKFMEIGEGIPKDIRTGKYSAFREGKGMYLQKQPTRMVRIRNFLMMGLMGGFIRPEEAHRILRKGLGRREFTTEILNLIRFGARLGKESGFTTMDIERTFDEIEASWAANLKQNAPEVLEEITRRIHQKDITMGDVSEQTFGKFMKDLDISMGTMARSRQLLSRDEFSTLEKAEMFYERGGALPSVIMRLQREYQRSVELFKETGDIDDAHPLRPLGKTNKEVYAAMNHIKGMMNKDLADPHSEIYEKTFGNLQKLSELTLNIGLATNISVWWPQNSGT